MPMKKKNNRKIISLLIVLLSIVGVLAALIFCKKDKYIMFYTKQSLGLFIMEVAISLITKLDLILFEFVISPLLWILFLILIIMTCLNAISGKKKKTLLIGEYFDKINL
jgi:uncharacterized membrane protein